MQLKSKHKHSYLLIVLQLIFLVLFGLFVRYSPNADAKYHGPQRPSEDHGPEHHPVEVTEGGGHHPLYGMFQDVHVMIFIGFGFLMTFLKKYGYGAVGLTFLIAAVTIQWSILVIGFFHLHDGIIEIDLGSLIGADFVAAAVLISFGALLGKTTPTQLIIIAMLEVPIFVVNEIIGRKYFGAVDSGDSMFVHAFGAYFGLAVSRMLAREDASTPKEGATKTSDTFAMIGTVFLWVYWPSFNGATAPGDDQHRAVINTYIALVACCVTAFAVSSLVDDEQKFDMVHIQNSTLAGGVAIGTAADLMAHPFGAMLVGIVAGVLSVCGYHFLSPVLHSKLKIHDTCGVNNLHGMPAILAGVVGAIYAGLAEEDSYGLSVYDMFPERVPMNGTQAFNSLIAYKPGISPGSDRSAAAQAGFQLLALGVSIISSIVGGVLTGLVLRLEMFNDLETNDLYEDAGYWKIEEEDEYQSPSSSPVLPIAHKES